MAIIMATRLLVNLQAILVLDVVALEIVQLVEVAESKDQQHTILMDTQ